MILKWLERYFEKGSFQWLLHVFLTLSKGVFLSKVLHEGIEENFMNEYSRKTKIGECLFFHI